MRLLLVLALAAISGLSACTWPDRPDGGSPYHGSSRDALVETQELVAPVEPLDAMPLAEPAMPAADASQPATP